MVNGVDVRIAVDNICQNKAILRARNPSRAIDDLIYEVNGATVFSTLDIITKVFDQFMLDDEPHLREHAQGSTALQEASHGHLMRFGNLHGANTSHAPQDIPGALVFGKNEEDHQKALLAVLRTPFLGGRNRTHRLQSQRS